MIDDAIAVEKEGLKGKVYLDARGLATLEDQVQRGAYPDYDQSLLQAAEALRKYSSLEVVLDKRQDLFQPGDCPDAALYCGWYSLAQYIDAFEWNRGAVGYHMASAEATKLRDPESEVWCKRMLEDGVCATLGPVAEPYIAAFPRPSEFFPLLASGKFTLAEVYWRTVPFASWQMILIGDPLYNPYGQAPPLKIDQVDDEAIKRLVLGPQTVLPVPSK